MQSHIIHFLSDPSLKTIESARNYLITLRDKKIDGFSLSESRSLWYSLLLYKFRYEENVPTDLWEAARNFILETLRNQKTNTQSIFLSLFNSWKKSEYNTFIDEVFEYYVYAQKIGHDELVEKIKGISSKMGFLEILDKKVEEMKTSIVKDVMHQAFWDMVEDDIRNKEYSTVICQLTELQNIMKEIIPVSLHTDMYEKFNVEYIHQRILSDTFDKEYLSDLCHWIILTIKEWDSASSNKSYDQEIETYEEAVDLEWPTFIRFSLELCTLLALDAKLRISMWRTLLK